MYRGTRLCLELIPHSAQRICFHFIRLCHSLYFFKKYSLHLVSNAQNNAQVFNHKQKGERPSFQQIQNSKPHPFADCDTGPVDVATLTSSNTQKSLCVGEMPCAHLPGGFCPVGRHTLTCSCLPARSVFPCGPPHFDTKLYACQEGFALWAATL